MVHASIHEAVPYLRDNILVAWLDASEAGNLGRNCQRLGIPVPSDADMQPTFRVG